MHFILCDRTWVVWWSSIQDVGTFGLARGRQLKSFWLVFIRLVGATLLVSWLGAWLDSMIDRSIAWPGTSLPRCECTFLPWPYLGADVHRFAACDEGFWMWYMCGMLFLRTWKHKFEDFKHLIIGSMWPSWHLARQAAFLRPWSDSMTGVSMAGSEHHYIGLTVHSCPGLITFSLFGSVCGFKVHV